MVKNPPAMQGTRVLSVVWGDSTGHPSLCPTAEPLRPRAGALQQEPVPREARAPQLERRPRWLQLEKAHVQQ